MTMEQPITATVAVNNVAFMIAGWTIEPATLRITKQNFTEKLEPKAMAVLEYLAARPGQVVSRKELEENVWTGTVVGYDAISNAIIKLRKAFGDDAHNPQVIETIPKSGYRLIANVDTSVDNEAQSVVPVAFKVVDDAGRSDVETADEVRFRGYRPAYKGCGSFTGVGYPGVALVQSFGAAGRTGLDRAYGLRLTGQTIDCGIAIQQYER